MTGPLTRVREIQGVGFEVVRESQKMGRRSIAFRLHAEDANEVAREIFEMDQAFALLAPDGPAPRVELWEDAGRAATSFPRGA
ncbi:hypothetical protein [uncultured Novosphingobium sp.]|uniref:hypothetical protein n=1 Tax=uncultured Novosphingobium sp. TaxID=292277 RepID=UPI002597559A|nr:hypothetical protein [uncultured Novosphingobium sp.]